MQGRPSISIIVPVYNGQGCLERCLEGLLASSYKPYEIIVVDDASTDNSAETSRSRGVTVCQLPRQSGPAAARNFGAAIARGEILLFVDADVVVRSDTTARVAQDFVENPAVVAVFGSYDDSPVAPDFVSQYRNLLHHFVHQQSQPMASTFWAGCGAIYRDVFHRMQGFDERRYARPSVEDIELGLRMSTQGYRILLDKGLQVKHLKHWSWRSLIQTDILQRAVPWSRLILETGLMRDLNLQTAHRISALLVGMVVIVLPMFLLDALNIVTVPMSGLLPAVLVAIMISLLLLNRDLYTFLYRRRGLRFAIGAIPLHLLYYFYSGVAFCSCWILHKLPRVAAGWKHGGARQ